MKGSRVKGRGTLEHFFDFLRAARGAFSSMFRALQITRGTALCSPTRYGAYSGLHLPIGATKCLRRVLTHFAARFFPYAFLMVFSFNISFLEICFVVVYISFHF